MLHGTEYARQWPQYLREYAESQVLQAGGGPGGLSLAPTAPPEPPEPSNAPAGHLHEAGHPAGQDVAKGAQTKGRHKVTNEIVAKTNQLLNLT